MTTTSALELTLGERLRIFRQRAGLRQDQASEAAQQRLPATLSLSRELIRRLEAGLIPSHKANPVHLAALAEVYGVDVGVIHPAAEQELAQVIELAARAGVPAPPPRPPGGRQRRRVTDR